MYKQFRTLMFILNPSYVESKPKNLSKESRVSLHIDLQYIQGSGQSLLKLPVCGTTVPPCGHRAFSSRGRCLATLTTKRHILKRRKAMAGKAGCSQGSKKYRKGD